MSCRQSDVAPPKGVLRLKASLYFTLGSHNNKEKSTAIIKRDILLTIFVGKLERFSLYNTDVRGMALSSILEWSSSRRLTTTET